MSRRVRPVAAAFVIASLAAGIAACGSQGTSSTTSTPRPTASPSPQVVKVLANPKNCNVQPMIVNAGQITVSATSTADIPISVNLFAPQDGAFRRRIARIRILRPNETKTMSADLALGAYEMSCGTEVLESRTRITAI